MKNALVLLLFLSVVIGCAPRSSGGPGSACEVGETACYDNAFYTCVEGRLLADEQCAGQCAPTVGCAECFPEAITCSSDGHAEYCGVDGEITEREYCDPFQGMLCVPGEGCTGACAPSNLPDGYVGCEYYPTVTANRVRGDSNYAVIVSNASSEMATVHVESGALPDREVFTVPPNDVVVYTLPWVDALKACTALDTCGSAAFGSERVTKGAYHLRADRPVTVYQFSPLEYETTTGLNTYSNDASLLLPTTAWGFDHVVAAGEAFFTDLSVISVTASEDDTMVDFTVTIPTVGSATIPAFSVGSMQTVTMSKGETVQLLGTSGDFTGSFVRADKPVQVIGGAYCGNMPSGEYCCCDHMEHILLPIRALGANYLVTAPWVPSQGQAAVKRTVMVAATEPLTTLTFDPPQPGVLTELQNAGTTVRFSTSDDIAITADKKIMVAEYMSSAEFIDESASADSGDPALTAVAPTEQFRDAYLFHAPTNYDASYVNVIAPTGAVITLDGVIIPADSFTQVGGSDYAVARMLLADTNGDHSISGTEAFGISVYGYGSYTSYWYVGGLNVQEIEVD